MGRTIEPYSIQMKRIEERLRDFRRGLRKADQEAMDTLICSALVQVQAGVMASNPNPLDSMFLSMLIHLQKENELLKKEITNIKNSYINIDERPSL